MNQIVFMKKTHALSSQDTLDDYFNSLASQKKFSGSILIAQKANVLFEKSCGFANYEHKVANTPKTKFRIASVTKQFTAAAILRLQEKKIITVQDPVSKFIPNYPNGDNITIHHLLTHTSGIANYTDFDEYWQTAHIEMFHEQIIEYYKKKQPYYEPGEKVQYNNTGYVLLAYIIEQVTQKLFIEFLTDEFFKPIGMHNTGFASQKEIIENQASGYIYENSTLIHADKIDMRQQSGAGFLYSTVEDLYFWSQELHNKIVISEQVVDNLTKPYVSMKNWSAQYGYGLLIDSLCSNKRIFHPGAIKGFRSILNIFPEQQVCIIILSNFEHTDYMAITHQISKIIFKEK